MLGPVPESYSRSLQTLIQLDGHDRGCTGLMYTTSLVEEITCLRPPKLSQSYSEICTLLVRPRQVFRCSERKGWARNASSSSYYAAVVCILSFIIEPRQAKLMYKILWFKPSLTIRLDTIWCDISGKLGFVRVKNSKRQKFERT